MPAITPCNPAGVHPPVSSYAHAMLLEGAGRRLLISAQVGVAPDGSVAHEAGRQMDQVFANLSAILAANGMGPRDVVKLSAFLTGRLLITPWRMRRDAWLGGHVAAATLLLVSGFADPRFVVEVEAEAFAQ